MTVEKLFISLPTRIRCPVALNMNYIIERGEKRVEWIAAKVTSQVELHLHKSFRFLLK